MANEFIIRKGFKSQEDSQITGSISLSGSFKDQESSSGTAGQVLSSTVSGSQWVDAADSSAITGAGTTGTITKWTTGGSVIGDSIITEAASAITVSGAVTLKDLNVIDTYANDPLIKLAANTSGNAEVQIRTATTSYNPGIGIVTSGYDFNLFTANTPRLTLTSGGIITVGSQPAPPWISGRDIIQLGDRGNINAINSSGNIYINNNIYVLANGNNASVKAGGASQIRLSDNDILFYTSNVASAANEVITLTPKLTISSGGAVRINNSLNIGSADESNYPLQVRTGTDQILRVIDNVDGNGLQIAAGTDPNFGAYTKFQLGNGWLKFSSGGDVEVNNLIKFVDPTAGSAGTPQFKTLLSYQYSTVNALSTIKGGNEASGTNGTYLKFSVNSSAAVNTPIDILTLKSAFVGGTTAQFDALIKANNGISFPNQSAGSGTVSSSTLDAYEEGTWTPTLLNANGNESTSGTYTRIGNIVRVGGLIIFGSQSDTTQLTIQSFPFQVGSTNEGTRGGVSVAYSTSSTYYTILMDDGSTKARVWAQGATGNPTLAGLSGTRVYFGGTYQI